MIDGFFEGTELRHLPARSRTNRNFVPITIYYQNVRGLSSKTVEFYNAVRMNEFDMIALTETWCNDSISDSEIFDDRYVVFRKDRMTRGGGVLLAVRRGAVLSCERLEFLESAGENLWTIVRLTNVTVIVCVVYFAPRLTDDVVSEFFNKLYDYVDYLSDKKLLIFGDFNSPSLKCMDENILMMTELFDLIQVNNVFNEFGSKLDLIFTNADNCCNVIDTNIDLVAIDSYHPALNFDLILHCGDFRVGTPVPSGQPSGLGWLFRNVDFDRLNTLLLAADWGRVFDCVEVNAAVEGFYQCLYEAFDILFQRRCLPASYNGYPRWFSSELIHLIARKNSFHKMWKKFHSAADFEVFKTLRKRVKALAALCHSNYVEFCERSILQSPRNFWKYLSSRRDVSSLFPNVSNSSVSSFTDGIGVADRFAQYFQTVFNPSTNNDIFADTGCASSSFPLLAISQLENCDLEFGFGKLSNKISSGPDLVPDFIFKGCKRSLIEPLTYLFNLSLKLSTFPSLWKCAKVTPIFKKGDRLRFENYRPISVLSAPAKVFELIIHRYVYNHCQRFFINQQHGFRPTRSVVSNLLCFTNFVGKSLDSSIQVDVIYTDFEKAFDRVDHSILIKKLFHYGFSNSLVDFFKSYLSDRKQYVSCGLHCSSEYHASSGVPQGSNLGPLLFLLFINDINLCINNSQILLFADDLKVFGSVRDVSDYGLLQSDLESIYNWSIVNRLAFNFSKCHVVSYSRSSSRRLFNYEMGGNPLSRVESTLDLGILFTHDFKFCRHIEDVCRRATGILGFVLRNARYLRRPGVLRLLYCSLVRSTLEFGSIVWNPAGVKYSLMLERVQGKFLRFLFRLEFGYFPYLFHTSFLREVLSFESLASRRIILTSRYFFGVLRGFIDNPYILSQFLLWAPVYGVGLRNRRLFLPIWARTSAFRDSSVPRAVRMFNVLGERLDLFTIRSYELDVFVRCNLDLLGE